MEPDLALRTRSGLPDALRVLLADYPRDGWAADAGFDGMVRFWLERHMMFRRLLAMLRADAQAVIDREMSAPDYARRLSRLGGHFLADLEGHHQIEDQHYFPVLARQDGRIARGFDILDADHQALHAELDRFADAANGVLRQTGDTAQREAAAAFLGGLTSLSGLLDRHLVDEEELVVPVILKFGTDALPR